MISFTDLTFIVLGKFGFSCYVDLNVIRCILSRHEKQKENPSIFIKNKKKTQTSGFYCTARIVVMGI